MREKTPTTLRIGEAPEIGDRIKQRSIGISYDCVLTGTVVAVNKRHRHYTLEFTLPPNIFRKEVARFKECYKY